MTVSAPLFTFRELVQHVAPYLQLGKNRWKVVRHRHNAGYVPDLVELLHFDREAFEYYQSDQSKDHFGRCEGGIFSFLGLPGGRALFVGGYRVKDARVVSLPKPEDVPAALRALYANEHEQGTEWQYRYDLVRDSDFSSLELRAVIHWGGSLLSWHQWDLDKPVVELRDPNAMPDCPPYADIEVSLAKLAFLIRHEEANTSWKDRLSAVPFRQG